MYPPRQNFHVSMISVQRHIDGADRLCAQVQACLRGASSKVPQLVRCQEKGWRNPTGTGLALPGNQNDSIACGICGTIFYSNNMSPNSSVSSTYSCSPCLEFLTPIVHEESQSRSVECQDSTGQCTVLPYRDPCHGCWLLLCLLGCQFPGKTFSRLLSMLPEVFTQRHPLDKPLAERGANSVSSASATSEETLGEFRSKQERRWRVHAVVWVRKGSGRRSKMKKTSFS